MARRLLTVLAVAVIVLAIVWFAGGRNLVAGSRHGSVVSVSVDDDDEDSDQDTTTRRRFLYDGSQPLTIDAPVTLRYVRGGASSMTVAGPRSLLAAVRFESGRLYLAGSHHLDHALTVTVTAPRLPGITLRGAGDLKLEGLDQPALAIDIEGAGNVVGTGKVGTLSVESAGAGDVDLSGIRAGDAKIKADGFGNIDVAATGAVDVAIAGAGNVSLHAKPRILTTSISGIGRIGHDY